jgi:hypothetical protein
MVKFETTLAYDKKKIIDRCRLEITSGEYKVLFSLNREEVKQLLDLMQEAYDMMGKKYEG